MLELNLSIKEGLIELRKYPGGYELLKWHAGEKTCHVIAHFKYNSKEPCWYMETVGCRLWLDDYDEQENVWEVIEQATRILGVIV